MPHLRNLSSSRTCSRTWILAFTSLLLGTVAGAQESGQVGTPTNAPASAPTPGIYVETVDVEVVNIEVFVTDKKGVPVTGLGKSDFQLRVDGKEVPIPYFYAASGGRTTAVDRPAESRPRTGSFTAAPLTTPPEQRLHIAVVIDNDHIRAVNRARVFRKLRTFFDTRLAEDALVSVASLDPELIIHSDFLTDRDAVAAMLGEIERTAADRPRSHEIERRQILNELSTTGRVYNRRAYTTGGLATPDQALMPRIRSYAESEFQRSLGTLRTLGRMVDTLAGVPGRKALLYVSDGVENRPGEDLYLSWVYRYGDDSPAAQGLRSAGMDADYFREVGRYDLLAQFRQVADLANAARVSWYAIDTESDHSATLKSAAVSGGVAAEALDALENNLREPAELTAALTGGRRFQVSQDFDLSPIADDFGTYYSLGFTPEPGAEGEREIRVKVRSKGLVVRHRQSWKPRTGDERVAGGTLAALLYQAGTNELAVSLGAGTAERRDDGNYLLPVEVRIPLANLLLLPDGEVHATRLTLYVTTKDRDGQPRPVQKIPFGADIPADKLQKALGESVRYSLPLVVRPGDQQIAVGVRDELAQVESYVRLELSSLDLGER